MWHVYILKCSDGSFYTGITNDLDARIIRHNKRRGGAYTRARTPVTLVYKELHCTHSQALKRESQIKDLTRKSKFALIASK